MPARRLPGQGAAPFRDVVLYSGHLPFRPLNSSALKESGASWSLNEKRPSPAPVVGLFGGPGGLYLYTVTLIVAEWITFVKPRCGGYDIDTQGVIFYTFPADA
jgi:hypothetical protein